MSLTHSFAHALIRARSWRKLVYVCPGAWSKFVSCMSSNDSVESKCTQSAWAVRYCFESKYQQAKGPFPGPTVPSIAAGNKFLEAVSALQAKEESRHH